MLKKRKVSEIAKEAGVPGKEILQILKKMKIDAKTTSSPISEEESQRVLDLLKKVESRSVKPKKPAEGKPAAEKPAAKEKKAPAKKAAKPLVKKAVEKPAEKTAEKAAEKPVVAEKPKPAAVAPVVKPKPPAKTKPAPKAAVPAPAPAKKTEVPAKKKEDAAAPAATAPAAPAAVTPAAPAPVVPVKRTPIRVRADKVLNLVPRPPIVTVMGHVDHGKTSLLDAIRQTNVVDKEAGQITQHIGAYEVDVKAGNTSGRMVFLDTPGHEAFTAMRARGAQITDIVVLVVGADDGVMPQTIEAIDHARAAGVPLIVAINKIDKNNANPEQVKQQLSNYNLIPEDWGGDTICVPISALKKQGLDTLLEMILLQADMLELKADPSVTADGIVIEARLDRHMGPVATVIVREGTLRVGDYFIITPDESTQPAGGVEKVRALIDDRGARVKEATPSKPVEVLGLKSVPQTGELLRVINDKKFLKELLAMEPERAAALQTKKFTLEDLQVQIKQGDIKELNVILKTDVQGSQEAIIKAFQNLSTEEVKLTVIHRSVGEVNEADIMLASASRAIIIGFNVGISQNAGKLAEYEKVDIRNYRIIYDIVSDLKKAMEGLLPPKLQEVILGRAEIQTIFKISRVGAPIAGSRVTDGKITRDAKARLIREGKVIYDGKVSSLKRFKDDVRECEKGFECGITLDNFNDIKEHDVIQAYEMQVVK